MKNPYVAELLDILADNGKPTKGVESLIGYIQGMENFVTQAESKIADMSTQLSELREIQKHPVKNALRSAVQSLEATVSVIRGNLSALKASVIDDCKNAVTAFNRGGTKALDSVLSFAHIKTGLLAIKNDLVRGMGECDRAVAEINAFAKEYHSAGRAVKNMLRIMIGKPAIDKRKEAGKLAALVAAPYRAEKSRLRTVKSIVDKAIAGIDRLEQKADRIRGEDGKERGGSLAAELAAGRDMVRQREAERQTPEKAPLTQEVDI